LSSALVKLAPGTHEATTAGSDRNGHTASGGAAIGISSRIEIIGEGYRQSLDFVDPFIGSSDRSQLIGRELRFRYCLRQPLTGAGR
jgi:hypothetical protein